MIKIIVDTEGTKVKCECECNGIVKDTKEEFKILNKEFPNIRSELLEKFPIFIQAEILASMLEDLHDNKEGEE
jgi:hypothetical protein